MLNAPMSLVPKIRANFSLKKLAFGERDDVDSLR